MLHDFSNKRLRIKKTINAGRNKNIYGAIKKSDDGYTFDSIAEWKRYKRLKFELNNNNISDLEVHPSFDLSLGGDDKCVYSADFSYKNDKGECIIEDVKSPELIDSPSLRLKLRMLKAQYDIDVILIHPKVAYMQAPHSAEDDNNIN